MENDKKINLNLNMGLKQYSEIFNSIIDEERKKRVKHLANDPQFRKLVDDASKELNKNKHE